MSSVHVSCKQRMRLQYTQTHCTPKINFNTTKLRFFSRSTNFLCVRWKLTIYFIVVYGYFYSYTYTNTYKWFHIYSQINAYETMYTEIKKYYWFLFCRLSYVLVYRTHVSRDIKVCACVRMWFLSHCIAKFKMYREREKESEERESLKYKMRARKKVTFALIK